MGETPESRASPPKAALAAALRRVPWLAVLTLSAALATTVGSISLAGIWDSPEVVHAEWGRRIAHDLLGASRLGAPGEAPLTREALGRGELPFLSIGLGFRLLGLSTEAGRLMLAAWGLAGLAALHWLVRRLHSRRAAWLAGLVLATTPFYFVQARTMVGDVVGMSANAAATAGLALAVFEPTSWRRRAASLALALVGLGAGFWSRGILIGVAVPLLGVGLAWLLLAFAGSTRTRGADVVGGSALVVGCAIAVAGALVLARTPVDVFSIWLGATTAAVRPQPTFDIVLRDLGHAFFPWSALVLPAFARLAHAPDEASFPRQGLRLTLLTAAVTAGVAQTALAPALGLQSFVAPAALAGACALALDELDEPGPVGRWFGLAVAATLVLLLLDFKNFPEKGLVAFGVNDAVFPAAYADYGFAVLAVATLPLALVVVALVGERLPEIRGRAFRKRAYRRWFRIARRVWSGSLWFALIAVGSACIALDAFIVVTDALAPASSFVSMSPIARALVRVGWVAALGALVLPLGERLVRDGFGALLATRAARGLRTARRGLASALAFSAGSLVLSFGYYTALAQELSPKRAFDEYERVGASAPLGLLGVSPAVARYQAGVAGRALVDADEAVAFLLQDTSRRFVALRANELAGANAVYRSKVTPRQNLPVLDSHAGEIVLASNRLEPSRRSDNPFDRWVLSSPPSPGHPLDVDLGGRLTVLGWDVFDSRGARVSALSAAVTYEFAIYYRVDQRMAANWDTFLHIDGFQRRFNGDHPTLGGHYPFALWLPGDFIVDRHEFHLGPEFSRGRYDVYFGLYSGSRRLEVRRGAHQDDRVAAGKIDVK